MAQLGFAGLARPSTGAHGQSASVQDEVQAQDQAYD
jgi:hypothetical protein